MSSKIEVINGKVITPENVVIPFIEGDGIGHDITQPTQNIINTAIIKAYKGKRSIEWMEVLAGEKAFKKTGEWLPQATLDAFKEFIVGIKGPLTTPIGGGIRSLNVALRQNLDLFVCLRPIRWFKGVPSPVKHPEYVNMHIFRENTEDIYAGIEFMAGTPEAEKFLKLFKENFDISKIRFPESSSFGVKPISKDGSERLIRSAIEYALERNLPSLTIVHKGNIMKFTEGAFKNWGYDLAEKEFGSKVFTWRQFDLISKEKGKAAAQDELIKAQLENKLIIKDVITDAFLQETLLHPKDHSVIATMNLNGDYISDQLAAMVGGIGIAPGANINFLNGYAIFEATHGTAPNIAGSGKANPCSLILSAVMMLEYLGWNEAAQLIYSALEKAFSNKKVTYDLYELMEGATLLSTSEFADYVVDQINGNN